MQLEFLVKDLSSIPLRLSLLFKKVVVCGHCLVTLSLAINETLIWLSSLPILRQESFWWLQCSDRYIIWWWQCNDRYIIWWWQRSNRYIIWWWQRSNRYIIWWWQCSNRYMIWWWQCSNRYMIWWWQFSDRYIIWRWQCSDRSQHIISLFPHLHSPAPNKPCGFFGRKAPWKRRSPCWGRREVNMRLAAWKPPDLQVNSRREGERMGAAGEHLFCKLTGRNTTW